MEEFNLATWGIQNLHNPTQKEGITYLIKTHDVIPQVGATCRSHNLDATKMLAHVDTNLAHLQSQLTSWHQHYGYMKKEAIYSNSIHY